jgi:tRNA(adenine34) deaminase
MMDEKFMLEAIKQANKAALCGEMPVGAVIVQKGKIIARGYNKRETRKNALLHAEVIAINKACKKLCGWRLLDCDIYITLEPCPMCAGAILNARINNVYFGAYDTKSGCAGSVMNLFDMNLCNYKSHVQGGILKEECSKLIKDFFETLRKRKNLKFTK